MNSVSSPAIVGGLMYATGQGRLNQAAYYICSQYNSYASNVIGYLSYDTSGAGTTEEARNRVWLKTVAGIPLKIESAGHMSIEALGGMIFVSTKMTVGGGLVMGASDWGSAVPSFSGLPGQVYFKT